MSSSAMTKTKSDITFTQDLDLMGTNIKTAFKKDNAAVLHTVLIDKTIEE